MKLSHIALPFLCATCSIAEFNIADLTETEFDDMVSSNVVAVQIVFRAGNLSTWALLADNYDENTNTDEINYSLEWSLDLGNSIHVSWDNDGSGILKCSIIPANGDPATVQTRPLTWFNTILISVGCNGFFISDFALTNNDIDGDTFRDLSASKPLSTSEWGWDGIKIDLDEYDSFHQDSLTLNGILTPKGLGGSGWDFQGYIYFLQTSIVQRPPVIELLTAEESVSVSARNLPDTFSITNTLQYCTNLIYGSWSNLVDCSGITETNWLIPATAPQQFFRIITSQ